MTPANLVAFLMGWDGASDSNPFMKDVPRKLVVAVGRATWQNWWLMDVAWVGGDEAAGVSAIGMRGDCGAIYGDTARWRKGSVAGIAMRE
eukprot:5296474-Pleurochrysis_carterae.AAC.1